MSNNILVIGLGKSGHAAIKLLQKHNYNVSVTVNEKVSEQDKLILDNVTIYDGGHPLSLLEKEWAFIVKNPGVPYKTPFIQAIIKHKIELITEIELAYRYSSNEVLALTGTNGKTTTTTLIYNILNAYFDNVYCGGNIGIPYSDIVLNHPEDCKVILELSSFQLMGTVKFKPHIASIINLAPDHLDYMNSVEEYYESKLAIYQNQTSDDYYLFNEDDELLKKYVINLQSKVLRYSLKKESDIYKKDNWLYYYQEAVIDLDKIRLIGNHNLYNIMVALGYAKLMGVSNKIIQQEVYSFNGVEYRLEKVEGLKNNIYYNDSKSTTPDSTITAIEALSNSSTVLIMGGFDKKLDFNELNNLINKTENITNVIVYGQIKDDFKGVLNKPVIALNDLNAVIEYVLDNIEHETILFSPATSSYDQYNNYEERGAHFNKLIRGE